MDTRKWPSLRETIIVVCEGASENVYLQELNRFFREHRIPLTFIPQVVGNGACKAVISRYRTVKRYMKADEIIIWVDWDIYTHSEANNYANKPAAIPDFLFSFMNFEDFLVLHMDAQRVFEWQKVAEKYDHFQHPLSSAVYQPIFRTVCFQRYRKGKMPFKLNVQTLGQLFVNLHNRHIRFGNAFGLFLEERLKRMGWLVDIEDESEQDRDKNASQKDSD